MTRRTVVISATRTGRPGPPGASGAPIDDGATGTNKTWSSSKIAAAISAALNGLIQGAPGALDTLNELAAAMGDDPNFAATVTNALATKLNLSGGTMSGNLTLSNTGPAVEFDETDTGAKYRMVASNGGWSVQHWDATASAWVIDFSRYSNGQLFAGSGPLILAAPTASTHAARLQDVTPAPGVWTNINPPGGGGVEFQNGWENFSTSADRVAQYRLHGDEVQFRGTIKGGTIPASFVTMPAVPVSLRAHHVEGFALTGSASFGYTLTNGQVFVQTGTNTSVYINAVRYSTKA